MTRTPEQRLSDAQERRWYAPIPAEQMALGGKVNPDAARLALEDVLGKRAKSERKAA